MEPEVLAELVERHEPAVLETSSPGPAGATVEVGTIAAAAGTAGEAGTAAAGGTAGAAGGENGCCCR